MPTDDQNMKDHDLLITLNTKVDGLINEIKELKHGTQAKIADHEKRIASLERENLEVGGVKTVKQQAADNAEFIKDFKRTWKIITGAAGIIGSIIGFFAQLVFKLLGWI